MDAYDMYRWTGTEGDVYVLENGVLRYREKVISGEYVVIYEDTSLEEAKEYIEAQGSYKRSGGPAGSGDKPIRVRGSRKAPSPIRKGRDSHAALTKEQKIEITRRIKRHSHRLAKEMYLRNDKCEMSRDFKKMREKWIDFLKYWARQSLGQPTLENVARLCHKKPDVLTEGMYRYLIKPEEVGIGKFPVPQKEKCHA